MEIQFDCECGSEVSDFVRENGSEADFRVCCGECGALYAVTFTKIR